MCRRNWIQQIANLRITGQMGDAEETRGLAAPFPTLHVALVKEA